MSKEDVEAFKDVTCVRQTPKAILVAIKGKEHWIPQSQIDEDSEVYKDGDQGTLIIKSWLAEKLGLT